MSEKTINVNVFRFDPGVDAAPHYQTYSVPVSGGTSIMNVLDYIYQKLDPTLAYYDHAACGQSICGHCTMNVNGKPVLVCRELASGDMTVEPRRGEVLRDLVTKKEDSHDD